MPMKLMVKVMTMMMIGMVMTVVTVMMIGMVMVMKQSIHVFTSFSF